jgi:hypothetical protein
MNTDRFTVASMRFLFAVGCDRSMLAFPGDALSGEVVTEAVEGFDADRFIPVRG